MENFQIQAKPQDPYDSTAARGMIEDVLRRIAHLKSLGLRVPSDTIEKVMDGGMRGAAAGAGERADRAFREIQWRSYLDWKNKMWNERKNLMGVQPTYGPLLAMRQAQGGGGMGWAGALGLGFQGLGALGKLGTGLAALSKAGILL